MAGRNIAITVNEQGINRVASQLNKVNTIGNRVTNTFHRMTASLGKFAKHIWQRKLMIAAAMAGIAYAIFKPFMGLETTMARVRIAENATVEQTKALTAVASQLGRDTLYSASQAAEGMLFLAKAGLNVEQTMAAIPGVLQAAIVEELDLGTAADIVTGLLNEFSMAANQAGLAADVLAKGSNLAKTNMPEMSEALKYFGTTAHEMGYNIQQAVAMLDVLAGKMIRGSMAGTAMRQSMLLYQKIQAAGTFITKAQSDAIGRLGLDTDKLAKQIKSGDLTFIKFISTLKKAGATTGDFASIFEQRAAVAVNALAEAAETAFPAYVDQLNNAVGFTKEAGDILEDTLWGQTQQIKSSIQTMTNAIAKTFAPGLRDFLELQMRPFINSMTQAWEEGGITWQEKVGSVWAMLKPLMESGLQAMLDKIYEYTPKLATAIGQLGAELIPAFARGIFEGIKSIGMKIDTSIWEGLKGAPGLLWESIKGIPNTLTQMGQRLQWGVGTRQGLFPTAPTKPSFGYPSLLPTKPFGGFLPTPGSVPGGPGTIEERLQLLIDSVDANTDAVDSNTDATSPATEGGLGEVASGFMKQVGDQMLGSLEGTLLSAVTDPVTSALDKYLGPTSNKIGQLTDRVLHLFDFPMSGINTALDWLIDLMGGPSYTQGRYTHEGAYAYAGASGGSSSMSARSAVHVGEINVYGGGEDVGTAVVDQIAEHEALATHQMARSLKRGMLKQEAMER